MRREIVCGYSLATAAIAARNAPMNFEDYSSHDGLGLAALVRKGETTPSELLETAIARIEAIDPGLNAVVHKTYERARSAIAEGLPDAPLRGVPFLLKDLAVFYGGVPTTFGSRLFADFVPDHDSILVERQRAAGLMILGKSNTPEFGICAAVEPQLFGKCLNPWDHSRSPGGSSGGAAVAVATGMVPLAHATDAGGSIRIPAANCGLFGLKPTRGRTSQGPDLGEGLCGMATGHCISRSVRDSAALLDATHGAAPGDPYAAPAFEGSFLDEVGTDPGRLRIALTTENFDGRAVHPECAAAAESAARLCEDLGHDVEIARPEIDVQGMRESWRVIAAANLWAVICARSEALGRDPRPEDVEPVTWLWAQEGRLQNSAVLYAAIQTMHRGGRAVGEFYRRFDVLLSSTMASPPLPVGSMDMTGGDLEDFFHRQLMDEIPFTPLFNQSGGAAMSVPLHWSEDSLPVGVHFGADMGGEALLLRLAGQLEQASPWAHRRPPA